MWREVPEAVDYVMYWWHKAANLAADDAVQRFGFITTNSITQSYNRRVVQTALDRGVSIEFAIPNHPWVDSTDGADVRVAMTVGGHEMTIGKLFEVVDEQERDGDTSIVSFRQRTGTIHGDLKCGANVAAAEPLRANSQLSFMGVTLVGQGFVIEPDDPLANTEPEALRRYIVGNELNRKPKNRHVIDFFGMTESEAQSRYPASYQHVLDRVKPERDAKKHSKDGAGYAKLWWIFAKSRPTMRAAISELRRYIAICRTAKHFVFQFVPRDILVESKVVAIALDDAYALGILSSRPHIIWAIAKGSRHGVGNDLTYNNSLCFETFPFPDCDDSVTGRIREIGERLDAHRKRQLAQHQTLTITETYNILEKLRTGDSLSDKDKFLHENGLVSVLKQVHDELDAAVLDSYGWPRNLSDEEILERLVALNAERAGEEAQGIVRWLRPEFQNPTGHRQATQTSLIDNPVEEAVAPAQKKAKLPWPKTLPERAQAVRSALSSQKIPLTSEQLAKLFLRANVEKVEELLVTLASLGQARELPDGRFIATTSSR